MARVKTGKTNHQRHLKVLKLAKGYFGGKHCLYKSAHEQVMHSGKYAYNDRRKNKSNFRKLWIQRINAAARMNDLSYSMLMHGLKLANININRKVLAEIAVADASGFAAICDQAKAALN
ncbi:50S ribosomal protein L20 [bacterium]|nr:50S ribosomal protein L20 [bacterium]